jgi:hypothetical protein
MAQYARFWGFRTGGNVTMQAIAKMQKMFRLRMAAKARREVRKHGTAQRARLRNERRKKRGVIFMPRPVGRLPAGLLARLWAAMKGAR